jgi:hypothetical protein
MSDFPIAKRYPPAECAFDCSKNWQAYLNNLQQLETAKQISSFSEAPQPGAHAFSI